LNKIFSNKGISIMEALMAAFLTAIAVISLLPMQDISQRTGFRADYLGRAEGIMQSVLETREYQIMNVNNPVILSTVNSTVTVSDPINGTSAVVGDATFNVVTTTSSNILPANSWLVSVRVTWTGGPANGINSSIIVTRQTRF
jgi:Tfp pilus assembly protein PilV